MMTRTKARAMVAQDMTERMAECEGMTIEEAFAETMMDMPHEVQVFMAKEPQKVMQDDFFFRVSMGTFPFTR